MSRRCVGTIGILVAALTFQAQGQAKEGSENKPADIKWPSSKPDMLQTGVAPTRSGTGNNQPQASPQEQAFQQLVAQSPAPQWVREGVRLSYQVEPADDPRKPGGGVMSVDIVSVARGEVGLEVRQYSFEGANLVLRFTNGEVGMVARGSDYWMSPQLLQKLEQQPPPNVEVRKAKLTLGGKQIPVFAVVARNSTTSYDEESGVLLHHTNGQINTKLVELRQRKLPWLEGRPPAWLGRTKQFTYTGALRSAQQPDIQVTQTIDVLGLGPNTLVGKGSAVAANAGNSPPEERFIVSGSSQTDGYWLPPLDLKDLKQGQLIDEDRVVNARVTVGGIGRAAYGRNVVTIVEDAPAYSVISDFELETGILLMRTQAFKSFGMQITLSLTGLR